MSRDKYPSTFSSQMEVTIASIWRENINLLLTEREVRTKTTEGQYSLVRLEQARLVSSLLYGYGTRLILSNALPVSKFKGLPARDDASNLERTSYHDS